VISVNATSCSLSLLNCFIAATDNPLVKKSTAQLPLSKLKTLNNVNKTHVGLEKFQTTSKDLD